MESLHLRNQAHRKTGLVRLPPITFPLHLGLDSHMESFSSPSNTPSPSQGRPHSSITSDCNGQSSSCQEYSAVRASNPQSGLSDILSSPTPLTCPTPQLQVSARRTLTSNVPPSPSSNPVSAQAQIASLPRSPRGGAVAREGPHGSRVSSKGVRCAPPMLDKEIACRQRREAQLHAYVQYLTHVLQMHPGAYPCVPIVVPALVASPLPGAVHSTTTHQFRNHVLENTRGRRRKREEQDDGIVGNSDMDILPLCNEVVGTILKRRESLGREIQPPPPRFPSRFPSLPDIGHPWYVGGTETEELNGAAAGGSGENEAVGEENA